MSVVSGVWERAAEDGRNQVTLGVPGSDCRLKRKEGSAAACLEAGQEGVTKISSTPNLPLAEADIVIDRGLLRDGKRLEEVLVHELGHVLGLAHATPTIAAGASVMHSPAPRGINAPTSLDLRSVRRGYRAICGQ